MSTACCYLFCVVARSRRHTVFFRVGAALPLGSFLFTPFNSMHNVYLAAILLTSLLPVPTAASCSSWPVSPSTHSGAPAVAEARQIDSGSIMITRDTNEVVGMTKVGEVEGRSPLGGGVTSGMGDKRAIKKLRAAAAKLGATKVLIVNEEYRNMTVLYGIAYK